LVGRWARKGRRNSDGRSAREGREGSRRVFAGGTMDCQSVSQSRRRRAANTEDGFPAYPGNGSIVRARACAKSGGPRPRSRARGERERGDGVERKTLRHGRRAAVCSRFPAKKWLGSARAIRNESCRRAVPSRSRSISRTTRKREGDAHSRLCDRLYREKRARRETRARARGDRPLQFASEFYGSPCAIIRALHSAGGIPCRRRRG